MLCESHEEEFHLEPAEHHFFIFGTGPFKPVLMNIKLKGINSSFMPICVEYTAYDLNFLDEFLKVLITKPPFLHFSLNIEEYM